MEWYAARTEDEADRLFLLRKAEEWTKLAKENELEVSASAASRAYLSTSPCHVSVEHKERKLPQAAHRAIV
jgi:hypothetical protein